MTIYHMFIPPLIYTYIIYDLRNTFNIKKKRVYYDSTLLEAVTHNNHISTYNATSIQKNQAWKIANIIQINPPITERISNAK